MYQLPCRAWSSRRRRLLLPCNGAAGARSGRVLLPREGVGSAGVRLAPPSTRRRSGPSWCPARREQKRRHGRARDRSRRKAITSASPRQATPSASERSLSGARDRPRREDYRAARVAANGVADRAMSAWTSRTARWRDNHLAIWHGTIAAGLRGERGPRQPVHGRSAASLARSARASR